jgi:hypothetical protein
LRQLGLDEVFNVSVLGGLGGHDEGDGSSDDSEGGWKGG